MKSEEPEALLPVGQQQIRENTAGDFIPVMEESGYHSHGLLRDKGGGALLLLQIEEGYPIVSIYEYQSFLRTAEKSDVLPGAA